MTSVCFPIYQDPSEKGVYSKRKESAPKGSRFFPLREEHFSEGKQNNFERVIPLESFSSY